MKSLIGSLGKLVLLGPFLYAASSVLGFTLNFHSGAHAALGSQASGKKEAVVLNSTSSSQISIALNQMVHRLITEIIGVSSK